MKRKELNLKNENQEIEKILEKTSSTKNINKKLSLGNKWISYVMDEDKRFESRKDIIRLQRNSIIYNDKEYSKDKIKTAVENEPIITLWEIKKSDKGTEE